MSDLNDDILTYELGDDIDDQALLGADEDELLLSDEELEKDVTKEVKQQLKADAEQWVQEQTQEKNESELHRATVKNKCEAGTSKSLKNIKETYPLSDTNIPSKNEENVSTSMNYDEDKNVINNSDTCTVAVIKTVQSTENQTTETLNSESLDINDINQAQFSIKESVQRTDSHSINEPLSSKSNKRIVTEKPSASNTTTTDTVFPSSQESVSVTMSVGSINKYSDPREDYEEREERTNIKVTSERELDLGEFSPEKQQHQQFSRFIHGKRNNSMQYRPQGMRPMLYHNQRPLLRFPPHGQFPQHGTHNPFGSHAPPPQQHAQSQSALLPQPQHDPMQHPQMRQQFPGFRPGLNQGVGFRHPNSGNMFPHMMHEYNGGVNVPSQQQFNPSFPQAIRGMFRGDNPNAPMITGMRPNMQRMQRPLGLNASQMPTNFMNNPGMLQPLHPHHQQQLQPQGQKQHQAVQQQQTMPVQHLSIPQPPGSTPTNAMNTNSSLPSPQVTMGAIARPGKVLINPNFKGGVEAATNKFIQETQFMSAINSNLQSDDELLRQQEEFINKNREHIEKRIHQRSPPLRRNLSRSRSRSRSRERSFSPAKRVYERNATERMERERNDRFERRDRDRDRERDRDRDRDYERDRERPIVRDGNVGNIAGNSIRGGGRHRGGGNQNNYTKRRRSKSPNKSGTGLGSNRLRERDRGNDNDNDADEDEEARAYRLAMEKQKALREKLWRDKEMKRRRIVEEKNDDKQRDEPNSKSQSQHVEDQQQLQEKTQKLTPILVNERKVITLKKLNNQQQHAKYERDDNKNHAQMQQEQTQIHKHSNQGQQQRKQIPTAKILPEAKRTISEHLSNASANSGSTIVSGTSQSNTAIIKPVVKKDHSIGNSNHSPKHNVRRVSTPSDDEVTLDYDEDELMLDEEDRLLATPSPSPPPQQQEHHKSLQSNRNKTKVNAQSRTPTPELSNYKGSYKRKSGSFAVGNNNGNSNNSSSSNISRMKKSQGVFVSSNRRVVLQTTASTNSSTSSSGGRNRRDGYERSSGGSSGGLVNSRKAIFERLDLRRQQQQQHKQQQANERNSHDDTGKQRKQLGHRTTIVMMYN